MKLEVDTHTHTHTYASGHAYSTLLENVQQDKVNGLKIFCTTDHSESMPGAPHHWFFSNQKILPRFISGIAVIRGVESNIMNARGKIDIPRHVQADLDWIIASLYEVVFKPAHKKSIPTHS